MGDKRRKSWLSLFNGGSITRKYATGYVLITVIAVLLFLVSFFSGRTLSRRYQLAVDGLLELNNLFP